VIGAVTPGRGEGSLDYRWWTPGGPTAGHLVRWALEAAEAEFPGRLSAVRVVDLNVLRPATPESFEWTALPTSAGDGRDVVTVLFDQGAPFAVGSVTYSPAFASDEFLGDLHPPDALPRLAYRAMSHHPGAAPPVADRFEHRPTLDPAGNGPRDGWDVVWVTPLDAGVLGGRERLATILDSWFPPIYLSETRSYILGLHKELREPTPMRIISAHIAFVAENVSLAPDDSVLVATEFTAGAHGHTFERFEMWNEAGELLAIGQMIRRLSPTSSYALP
jgi:hypothetical protein